MGRRGRGPRRRLDLRLVPADPRHRLRPPARREFRHSDSFRTIFAADELLYVLQGTLVLANPATGEVVRAEPGESSSSGATPGITASRTATSRCACSSSSRRRPPRVPPARTRGPGRTSSRARYAVDGVGRHFVTSPRRAPLRAPSWWSAGRTPCCGSTLGVLVGLLASTEHLTAGTLSVVGGREPGGDHGGEELLYVTRGALQVAAGGLEATLAPGDGFVVTAGTPHATRPRAPRSPRRCSAPRPRTRPTGCNPESG